MIVRGTTQKAGKVLVVNADPEINRILEVNLAHANLDVVSVQSGTEALSKLHDHESDIIILDTTLPDISYIEMCRRMREASPSSRVPVIIIGTRPQNNTSAPRTDDTIIHFVTKPFEPKEVVALVQGYLLHKERMANTHPMTGLPNSVQVHKEISRLLQQKATLAAIYVAMHDLTAVNKAYGYTQGDIIIRLLADIVSEAVRLFGNSTDVTGHLGGDKFLVISSPLKARTLCRRIIADYHRRIKQLYSDEHLHTGYASLKGSLEGGTQTPNMSMHIAVVTNQRRTFHHPLEFIEAASEQIKFLRNSPESNCYYDLKTNMIELSPSSARREITQAYKEGLKAMQGVLAWFDFLTRELSVPMNEMKNCLQLLESNSFDNLSKQQRNHIKALRDNYAHITRIVESVAGMAMTEEGQAGFFCDEVDIRNVLEWVMKQVEELAAKRRIHTDIEVVGEIGRIIREKKSLTQSLLYIIRHEIRSSPPESHLHICLSEKNDEQICIKISNPDHTTSARTLNALLQKQPNLLSETSISQLYPAKILVRSMGGELEASSEKGKGTTYTVSIPKKWRSWIPEVENLQLAMEISRKEAREALKNAQQTIASLVKQVSPAIKDYFERLSSKIQEMAVLGNRSLFIADECNTRLEIQQDRLLLQETEQSATSEAILTICRDMAKSIPGIHLFNPESTRRVVDCALAIAKEFRISENDRHALYHAALFKDLALAFSRRDSSEQMAVIRTRLNLVWKALSTVPGFSTACNLVLYRWEHYDGSGGSFGIKGADVPLGSRILAVADTYYSLLSDRSTEGKLTPDMAVQKIAEGSGRRFDPQVVNAFLMLWKRKELGLVLAEK